MTDADDPAQVDPQLFDPQLVDPPLFDPVAPILAKKDGAELTDDQIRGMVAGFTAGRVAPEQMSSLLMAIVLQGMTRREIATWTAAMIDSGVRMDFSGLTRGGRRLRTADKHSTGGVGDKVTLPLTPLVASFGVAVPQLSGRGLGHTGGTLDKLESILGWRAELSVDQMQRQLTEVGAMVCAATADLAPADRKLYALRDVTGTVASIPLIASSIMSKKIAEGTQSLVLDVKVGSGAFMKTLDGARELAETMVALGAEAGVVTSALLTDMSTPLGRSAGNAVEVAESLEVLSGGGPADVVELTLALAREMLEASGLPDVDPADHLRNGRAMDAWRAMIAAQGGDPDAPLPVPRHTHEVTARDDGHLTSLDALAVGQAAWLLGAGRTKPGEAVSATAGVTWHVGIGDSVRRGQPLLTLHTDDETRIPAALEALRDATGVGEADARSDLRSRVLERVPFRRG
ncbi:thymidine phosphorylase [Gordonia sp. (in: high G+C Gram-positive bacteria)]|uniref:thymidine phosphorylase n=1 Tax=Gordonia sp. (in: high G+C Gram-positive bacteria) TaxID=84139 RepID=UPI0016BB4F55|nr:thymidine phosphorylase [Gordonia sp. (in: high G+C Gram-positive bacteria)]NLG47839.1 thymidine phosphorylase [Gordonia sp. (in: high G+C Gram-positive bacteria)]